MVEEWLQKARRYIASHMAFSDVSEVLGPKNAQEIQAIANIELPSSYSQTGQTRQGVRHRELIRFIFNENFPLEAPHILLREDFPRVFPHLNPSASLVEPCIYAGSLSELLQQPGWMNEILNQLVDWLYAAAANDLINLKQGWEPMRSDNIDGFFIYDDDILERKIDSSSAEAFFDVLRIQQVNNKYYVGRFLSNSNSKTVQFVFRTTTRIINSYIPNPVQTLQDLYLYADSVGIPNLQSDIQYADSKGRNDSSIIVTLGIRRPVNLIGLQRSVEFITFMVVKQNTGHRLYISNKAKVLYLGQLSDSSPEILRRISGTKALFDVSHPIAIVGCGSVGSKIAMHLARNGCGPFLLVDNDIFLPHNNARHAMFCPGGLIGKADLLNVAIGMINVRAGNKIQLSASQADYGSSALIIESTASLAVRSYFMRNVKRSPLVSAALYDHGDTGLLLIEAKHNRALLCDIWAFLYKLSMSDSTIGRILFSPQTKEVNIGQSCRSSTLVVSDTVISLFAASFGLSIQKLVEDGVPRRGEIQIVSRNDGSGIKVDRLEVPEYMDVIAKDGDPISVRIENAVVDKMRRISEQYAPNEIGGVLVGTVFSNANRIVITDTLDAPKDSRISPSRFLLGTEGLEEAIRTLETRSKERITYLGTWHSHPLAGGPSDIDLSTLEKLELIRDREPTVCLIYSPDGIHRV